MALSGTEPLACQDTEHPWLWTPRQEGTKETGWAGCLAMLCLSWLQPFPCHSLRVSSIVSA